ncbi:hypothetical protein [Sphingorhabdus sp.]|uniref:hypothetical protein n=1 Tax=Sphingorhabdus sp. TaxID=1902408 RepID=UPI0038FC448D
MAEQPLKNILAYGEWLTHRYDEDADSFHLRQLDRSQHDAATFITDEYLGVEVNPFIVSRNDAMEQVSKTNPLHFIVHSAFCASTMLARGFNLPGVSMGLKEPVLLNDIVGWRRRGAPPAAVAQRLDHSLHMLARPFKGDQAVVVKPSNVFNALAPLALTMRPTSKAILLYAPLPVFLVSVARKGLWCRLWCRELLEGLITDGMMMNLGFEQGDYFRMSDLQVAAVGWLAQQRQFDAMVGTFGPERITTLDSETLTATPEAALTAAMKHFGLSMHAANIAGHPAFATHSKFGGAFDSKDRTAEHKAAADAYGDEIEKVLIWAKAVAETAGIPLDLTARLL